MNIFEMRAAARLGLQRKSAKGAVLAGLVLASSNLYASIIDSDWTFSGIANNGTGSASMNIKIDNNELTLTLKNTSPTTLNAPASGANAPGIVGFGFNLNPDILIADVTSYSLTAFSAGNPTQGSPTTLLSSAAGTWPWVLTSGDANNQGITLDYNPNNGSGVQEALYNPDATSGLAAAPNYFTEAIFKIAFATTPALSLTNESCGSGLQCITFVRMQNVGQNGAGSLKLPGTYVPGDDDDDDFDVPVPEPDMAALFGIGLMALGLASRRRRGMKNSG